MAPPLPVTKLASLLIKTLAKPVSARIKSTFKQNPMTKNILIGIGQITHRATTRMTIWSAGYKVRNIQPLEMEKALSQGADFVGEAFIFTVGGSLVVWEYGKSKEKELKKEQKAMERERSQLEQIERLEQRTVALEKMLSDIMETAKLQGPSTDEKEDREVEESVMAKKRGWLW